jgi:hypothetical protein
MGAKGHVARSNAFRGSELVESHWKRLKTTADGSHGVPGLTEGHRTASVLQDKPREGKQSRERENKAARAEFKPSRVCSSFWGLPLVVEPRGVALWMPDTKLRWTERPYVARNLREGQNRPDERSLNPREVVWCVRGSLGLVWANPGGEAVMEGSWQSMFVPKPLYRPARASPDEEKPMGGNSGVT